MRLLVFLFIIVLTSCTVNQSRIDYDEVLDAAQVRHLKAESLSEDVLLCEALEYYQALEPKDSARLSQATILTAWHYWWNDETAKAYDLLEPLADTNNDALEALLDLAYKGNDYAATYAYLCRIMEDEAQHTFLNYHRMSVLNFFLGNSDECKRLFNELPKYMKTPADSVLYFEKSLPNHADMLSDYGDQEKAIELQTQVLNHFIGKDNWWVAKAHLSLARYHILLGNFDKAEQHILSAEENADEYFYGNLAISSVMQQMKSILDYAKYHRVDILEWAHYGNTLQGNVTKIRDITDAKEASNQQLTEKNLKLTIEKQRTQITLTYVGIALVLMTAISVFYYRRKKFQMVEKEEELEILRNMVSKTQEHTHQKDDSFFRKILLQQLGVIRLAASNPTTANQEFLKRMTEITNQEIDVDSLLNWEDLYQTIDYIYDGFYTSLVNNYGNILSEKEIQLCCLLKANFYTKEISVVTQQSVRTVYQRKNSIRRTLDMPDGEDIAAYLTTKKQEQRHF